MQLEEQTETMIQPDPPVYFGKTINYLRMVGLWPEESPTLIYLMRGFFATVFPLAFWLVNFAIRVYVDLGDIVGVSIGLNNVTSCTLLLTKFLILYANQKNVLRMMANLAQLDRLTYQEQYNQRLQDAYQFYKVLTKTVQYVTLVFWALSGIYPLFEYNPEQPLPFPTPYDLQERPILRASLYIGQIGSLISILTGYVCVDVLLYGLIILGTVHLDVLRKVIINVTSLKPQVPVGEEHYSDIYGNFDEEVDHKLANCVKYHQGIIKYIESIQSTYTVCFFVQLMYSVSGICTVSFCMGTISPLSSQFAFLFFYFVIAAVQLTIYCAGSNEIMIKSALVVDACYLTNWTDCGPKVRKTLFIIMERAKRPCVLTALNFVPMSLETLGAVLGKSLSYLMVLKTLYAKED